MPSLIRRRRSPKSKSPKRMSIKRKSPKSKASPRRKTSPKRKSPRKVSAYAKFVKSHYHDSTIMKLPAGERFAGIAKIWKAKKH